MPIWSDNFNRADGPIGANYTNVGGTLNIVSNRVETTGGGSAQPGAITCPGSGTIQATVRVQAAGQPAVWLYIKTPANWVSYYRGVAYNSGADLVIRLETYNSSAAVYTLVGGAASSGVLRLTYNAGVANLYFDGTLYCSKTDSQWVANTHMGFYLDSTGAWLDDLSVSGDGQPQLFVSPAIVGTEDGDQLLSIQGQAVTWTVGIPGSPSFSVNDGALSGQQITSTQTATAIFSPPATAQTVTLLDSADGISATITVVVGTYLGGGGSGPGGLPTAVVDWLAAQAAHGGLVLADNDESGGSVSGVLIKNAFGEILLGSKTGATAGTGYSASADLIRSIFARVWGGEEYESVSFEDPGTGALKTDLLALLTVLSLAKTGGSYDVGSLARELSGFPGGSHQDILDAISGISGGDNQDVLDAIAAMQGDPLATVKAVLDLVYALGTTSNYDLQDVLDAIAAVRGTGSPDLAAVSSKLTAIQPSTGVTLSTIEAKTVAESVIQSIIDAGVLAIAGEEGATIAAALDLLNQIKDLLPGGGTAGAPVWPGVDGVTLGDSHALADDLVIDEPMDGLLFTITGTPATFQAYSFGSVMSYSRVGAVIFGSDRGDYERSQSFALETQIITPQTMVRAESAILRVNAGWTGTVRSWVRSA